MSEKRSPIGPQQKASLRAAAHAWEEARTGREAVSFIEGKQRKARYHGYARADVVLSLLDEIETLRAKLAPTTERA